MQAVPLGLITVPTPATPVQIWTHPTLFAGQTVVRTVAGFTGRTYLGIAGMNKSSATKTGVIRILSEAPGCGPEDGEVLVIRASDSWVDADVAGEGVMVTCYVA